ncbi:MAG: hypothetical protein KBC69_01385 [Candidatus Magasanikbacteria bacterium]|nr:hypothetical protein [Candidatus Magasanikbacteria bacterium]
MVNTCRSFGCILLALVILGGCGSTDKPTPICALISVNPNTPMGSQIGPGGTWDPKGEAQTVLAFTMFRVDGEGCQTATFTGLPMRVDPNTSQFVIGRNFRLVSELNGRLVDISVGTIMSDGKLNVKLQTRENLEKGSRYFQLHLDTSSAQRGDKLAIISGAVEYEISGKKFTSYQLWYAPPPIEY